MNDEELQQCLSDIVHDAPNALTIRQLIDERLTAMLREKMRPWLEEEEDLLLNGANTPERVKKWEEHFGYTPSGYKPFGSIHLDAGKPLADFEKMAREQPQFGIERPLIGSFK